MVTSITAALRVSLSTELPREQLLGEGGQGAGRGGLEPFDVGSAFAKGSGVSGSDLTAQPVP